jgi:hypothetical protein
MSRVKDLVDLIQANNEVYLLAPDRHVRSAFIQIDDLCELIMKSWLQIDTHNQQQHCLADLVAANLIVSQNHRNRFREYCECTCDQTSFEYALGIAEGSTEQTALQDILDLYQPLNTDQLQQQCLADLQAAQIVRGINHIRRFRDFYECPCNQVNFERALGIASGSAQQVTLQNILSLHQPLSTWKPTKVDGNFKSFANIISEVKDRKPISVSPNLHFILNRMEERRENRNNFFHNQNLTGLTTTEEQCLQAFCDLYELMDNLFPDWIAQHATPLLLAQMGAIKARKNTINDAGRRQKYNDLLSNWPNREERPNLRARGEIKIKFTGWVYEYCVIHYYPTTFYDALIQMELITR